MNNTNAMDNKPENLMFIFKEPRYYDEFFIRKFSYKYNVFYIHLNNHFKKTTKEILHFIKEEIVNKKIQTVIFEGDHLSIIDYEFINFFNNIKKGLLILDDFMYHEVNSISGLACDFLLTACPLSSSIYKQKGFESIFTPAEGDGEIFKKLDVKKEFDVLFFGSINSNRIGYLEMLKKNNINIKIVDASSEESKKYIDLTKLINKSKIVINFSKAYPLKKFFSKSRKKTTYQIKGRIFITGFCGTACVSEYTPALDLIFKNKEVPIFRNEKECLKIIQELLINKDKLNDLSERFYNSCKKFEDSFIINNIKKSIDEIELKKPIESKKFPLWYKFIFFKQKQWIYFRKGNLRTYCKESTETLIAIFKRNPAYSIFATLYIVTYLLIFLMKIPFKNKDKF